MDEGFVCQRTGGAQGTLVCRLPLAVANDTNGDGRIWHRHPSGTLAMEGRGGCPSPVTVNPGIPSPTPPSRRHVPSDFSFWPRGPPSPAGGE